jgi:hypothetical protein
MLVNVLLGVLGVLFSIVTLAALFFTVWAFGMAATCEPGDFFCGDREGQWVRVGILSLAIAAVVATLAFTLWNALCRRIRAHPDAWWLWYEKRRTDGPTITNERLQDANREPSEEAASEAEAKREEGDS